MELMMTLMGVFTTIGMAVSGLAALCVVYLVVKNVTKLMCESVNRIQYHYYGEARIYEFYDFLRYCKDNNIHAVLKYSKSNAMVQATLVRVALYALKKYKSSPKLIGM